MGGQRWSPAAAHGSSGNSRIRKVLVPAALLCAGLLTGYLLGAVPLATTPTGSYNASPGLEPYSNRTAAGRPGSGAVDWVTAPLEVLDKARIRLGIAYRGNEARSRRVVSELVAGEPITMALVGGSCAWGHGAARIGTDDFGPRAFAWLNSTFPHPGHVFHNGAIPGTPSGYMALCVSWHVPPTADLVIVEYALNDGWSEAPLPGAVHRRQFERLMRRLLRFPRRPAVLLLMIHAYEHRGFWMSAEDHQNVFAQYYSAVTLSWRDATWGSVKRDVPGFRLADISDEDERHPNTRGHQLLADLVAGYLQSVGRGLRERPWSEEDKQLVDQELLPPMLPGNYEHDTLNCIMDEEFHEAVTKASGFEWTEEGGEKGRRRKPGFVATEPGARLAFTIDSSATALPPGQEAEGARTAVTISRLCSYEHMGQAEVRCVEGCTCEPATMDGYWEERTSQTVGFKVVVSQAATCRLEVTVLEATSSGEHKVVVSQAVACRLEATILYLTSSGEPKVKINGVVVADEAGEHAIDDLDVLIDKQGGAASGFVSAPNG